MADRIFTLMAEIRALGHDPRLGNGLGRECALARDLREAKRQCLLSQSQLAEVAALPRFELPVEAVEAVEEETVVAIDDSTGIESSDEALGHYQRSRSPRRGRSRGRRPCLL